MQIDTFKKEALCVVTVLYKSESHIHRFLSGLKNNIECLEKIVIIDNDSQDTGSQKVASWCTIHSIQFVCITNLKNIGYAAAINQGIRIAEKNFEYILVTNNDLSIGSKTFSTLLHDAKESDADVLGIPGKSDDGEVFFGFNYKESYLKLNTFIQIKKIHLDFLIKEGVRYFPCDFPSGLLLLFRRSFFAKIGYFDEELFFSGDETDFAIRTHATHSLRSFISLRCYDLVDHVSFGTSGNGIIKNKNYVRGYVYLLLKHTDTVFSFRYWVRLIYFVCVIVYSRPLYAPFLIYHVLLSTFVFSKMQRTHI